MHRKGIGMKILVIDGNSILNRAFYGIKALTNKKGIPTNAITGFLNTYLMVNKKYNPEYIAVAFDLKAPTFRHKMYDEYKANRKGMPDELAVQLPYIKDIISAMGIKICELEGYEADDILGTLSRIAMKNSIECVVLTGDRDSLQLINESVKVHLASTRGDILFDEEAVLEKYGVTPKQLIEVKALMGDSSDNIPGVKGIGEKTALTLIKNYHDIDSIYNSLSEVKATPSVIKKLEADKQMAYISRDLGRINLEVPVDSNINDYKILKIDTEKLSEILTDLDMFDMMKKLDVKPSENIKKEVLSQNKNIFSLPKSDVVLFENNVLKVLSEDGSLELNESVKISEYLQSDVPKQTFDIKQLWSYAFENNFEVNNIAFDTVIAAYLLNVNSNDYSLEHLFSEYSIPNESENDKLLALRQLNSKLYQSICENNMQNILFDIEIPLAEVLSSMEYDGIALNVEGVRQFGDELIQELSQLEHDIYQLAGRDFNINSPKQLGIVLFDDLGLPTGKKTKTGYSTNAEVLESLYDKHEIVPKILQYRSLSKLNSTYVEGLLNVVKSDGRLHTTFKQTETRTGRISSTAPNIQNIPVRTPLGRKMRRFFIAQQGKVLVDADYSQIELRVLADISNDENMIRAFKEGRDIHTSTAAKVLGVPEEWVDHDMRNSAKAVNFGIVYGISAFSLSKDINVSVKEADKYIKEYFSNYKGVKEYMDKTVEDAKKTGFVTTVLGRKRFIPEILSKNKILQALGKRIAMNTPIQGSAADIIKIAMIKIYKKLKTLDIDAKLILQVHDELIVETLPENAERIKEIIKAEMQNAVSLKVPLTVDAQIGETWYDTH